MKSANERKLAFLLDFEKLLIKHKAYIDIETEFFTGEYDSLVIYNEDGEELFYSDDTNIITTDILGQVLKVRNQKEAEK